MREPGIKENSIVRGPFFPEPVRIISIKTYGNTRRIEAVGVNTHTFYNPLLSPEEEALLEICESYVMDFKGDAERFFLFAEAQRIRNAYQFDPLCAVNASQIDPLPHQIDAVYHRILKNPHIRFLLADDPGSGKTIMAGLILKELKYRGLVERTLIVVPGHLKDQWRREMKEKFQESFQVINRDFVEGTWGQNPWSLYPQLIVSIDFAKQEDILESLKAAHWDFVIVDEAHKMAAYKYGQKTKYTDRYKLGQILSENSRFLLFLTATPHKGDPENFRLFLELLEPEMFPNLKLLEESIKNQDNPLYLRRLKEDLVDFEGKPLFPPRFLHTVKFQLSDQELELYNRVTNYIRQNYNQALARENRNVTFALTVLQKRMASSIRAITRSLERRKKRLEELLERGALLQEKLSLGEDYLEELDDLEESERWKREEELEKFTSATTLSELKEEIEEISELLSLARKLDREETETKLSALQEIIKERLVPSEEKMIVFSESRDTMEYLKEKIKKWGYSVVTIHGGMNMDQRIKAEHDFKEWAQFLVATEAAGEGINLQESAWLMVNYDIPWNPNRIEQRMGRIHRYGQKRDVHIFNLVAQQTIEGKILDALFHKLEVIAQHLGTDKVVDVIGEVLPQFALQEIIMKAISDPLYLENLVAKIEASSLEEIRERFRQATQEALATRYLDISRVLKDQEKARENRLVPEYLQEFFLRAVRLFNIKLEQKREGVFSLERVPLELRTLNFDFKVKYGQIFDRYSKLSFFKEKAQKEGAELLTFGHPLLEGVIEKVLSECRESAQKGAIFCDPSGTLKGILWFLQGEIRDGKNEVAGRKLFAFLQNEEGIKPVNPSLLWDLKPQGESSPNPEPGKLEFSPEKMEEIKSFAYRELSEYKKELLQERKRDAEIKKKYGLNSLDALIGESEVKLLDLETRRTKGENIPEATLFNEKMRRADLEKKKTALMDSLEKETHLYPSDPILLCAAKILPLDSSGEWKSDPEIEKVGMEVAMNYEKSQGRIPEDVSLQALGYDIRSKEPTGKTRYIEVKARAETGPVVLTTNEWIMAHRLKGDFWLYIVENAATSPVLYTLQDPASVLQPEEEVQVVRYIVKDWKGKATLA